MKFLIGMIFLGMFSSVVNAKSISIAKCNLYSNNEYRNEVGALTIYDDLAATVESHDGKSGQVHQLSMIENVLYETEFRDHCYPKTCGAGGDLVTTVNLTVFNGKISGEVNGASSVYRGLSGYIKNCDINLN